MFWDSATWSPAKRTPTTLTRQARCARIIRFWGLASLPHRAASCASSADVQVRSSTPRSFAPRCPCAVVRAGSTQKDPLSFAPPSLCSLDYDNQATKTPHPLVRAGRKTPSVLPPPHRHTLQSRPCATVGSTPCRHRAAMRYRANSMRTALHEFGKRMALASLRRQTDRPVSVGAWWQTEASQ